MALLTLPAGTGFSLVADSLVRLAFGPLWIHSIPIVPRCGLTGVAPVAGAAVMFEQIIYVLFTMRHINVRVAAVWWQNWRSLLATMVWPVSYEPLLSWVSISGNGLALAATLTKAASLGSATYVVTLLAA